VFGLADLTRLDAFSRAHAFEHHPVSEGARSLTKVARNGITWACVAAGQKDLRNAADKQCGGTGAHSYLLHVFGSNAPPYSHAPSAPQAPAAVVMVQLNHNTSFQPHSDRPNRQVAVLASAEFPLRFIAGISDDSPSRTRIPLLLTDFDFQILAAVGHGKPKYGVCPRPRRGQMTTSLMSACRPTHN